MVMLLIALAAANMSSPTTAAAKSPAGWMTDDDYPRGALRRKEQGWVEMDLSVDARGRPVHCRVTRGSGSSDLDDASCSIFMRRARFSPALDENGQPIATAVKERLSWRLRGGAPYQMPPQQADIVAKVAKLPALGLGTVVVVQQVQSAGGSIESCRVDRPSGSSALDRIACQTVASVAAVDPVLDEAGKPVRGTRLQTIQFIQDPGTATPN